jgi:hypothetical protein
VVTGTPEELERREPPAKRPAPTGAIECSVGAETLGSLHGKEPVHNGVWLEHAASFESKSLYPEPLEAEPYRYDVLTSRYFC